MKIVIAGGSGFIGSHLVKSLVSHGHQVTLLSRNPEAARDAAPAGVHVFRWDGVNPSEWKETIDGADAVYNFSGASIAERWTTSHKRAIMETREKSTDALVGAIADARRKPSVFVNSSAVGYYGNVPEGDVTEQYPKGEGFLAEVVDRWEKAARQAEQYGVRVVTPRTGIVLGRGGGALEKLLIPFRLFVGGPFGSGNQGFPWVHIDDVVGAFSFALTEKSLAGPFNLAAPQPVTTREFCKAFGKALHRPSWAPVPGIALKLMLGEMAEETLLWGQRIIPKKLQEAGYTFKFAKLDEALGDIVAR
jgi:uncharacterized protein (TIGR01777 family)